MKDYLENIFPGKKIIVTHGQLPWDTLEKRIIEFKRKRYDILLSTTVIENWIDFPNVNTIFINDAQNFWISQIHQLRWRVWRSNKKWYCFLLFKKEKIKEDAAKRLKTIVDYSHLWAWFELAVKDLEIRWWWDILWIKQSWQSQEIWVNLFLEMLEDKIEELKTNFESNLYESGLRDKSTLSPDSYKKIKCTIDLNIWAYIDDIFFSSELDKINFYREIESLNNIEDLENIIFDFKKINENIPQNTNNFFNLLKLKIKASKYKIISIKKVWINYQIDFDRNITLGELKKFLELDKEINFSVVNINRLRSSNKNFENEKKFIQYMLQLFENKIFSKKVKLKKYN
jgi:transcription-repair coupling factor (superfamily II helicase)